MRDLSNADKVRQSTAQLVEITDAAKIAKGRMWSLIIVMALACIIALIQWSN